MELRKFFKSLISFALMLSAVCLGLCLVLFFFICPQYSQSYNAALVDKVTRLESIDEPKIILIGDSNVAYGFDSALIEEALGMPVVNLGLHGSLGNRFHEDIARFHICEGDYVVICHDSFSGPGPVTDHELLWITLENHFHLWRLVTLEDIPSMTAALPKYAIKCLSMKVSGTGNRSSGDSYARDAFNEYGDVAFERPDGSGNMVGALHTGLPHVDEICAKRLNTLNEDCRKQGATLLIAGFPIADDDQAPSKEDILRFQDDLSARLDCPVISDYRDYYFDYDLFYNTAYHLTSNGAKRRSEQFIKDLEAYLYSRKN